MSDQRFRPATTNVSGSWERPPGVGLHANIATLLRSALRGAGDPADGSPAYGCVARLSGLQFREAPVQHISGEPTGPSLLHLTHPKQIDATDMRVAGFGGTDPAYYQLFPSVRGDRVVPALVVKESTDPTPYHFHSGEEVIFPLWGTSEIQFREWDPAAGGDAGSDSTPVTLARHETVLAFNSSVPHRLSHSSILLAFYYHPLGERRVFLQKGRSSQADGDVEAVHIYDEKKHRLSSLRIGLPFRLQEIRTRRGLTTRQLAQLADISATYLRKIENGTAAPNAAFLMSIAAALDVELATILAAPARTHCHTTLSESSKGSPSGTRPEHSNDRSLAYIPLPSTEHLRTNLITVSPSGSRDRVFLAHHPAHECVLVLDGEVDIYYSELVPEQLYWTAHRTGWQRSDVDMNVSGQRLVDLRAHDKTLIRAIRARRGDLLYIKSVYYHGALSVGSRPARLLVVHSAPAPEDV